MLIESPTLLIIAAALAAGTVIVAVIRRIRMPRGAGLCMTIGMTLLALAAGGMSIRRPDPRKALVLVDLSPSTRTAAYRDEAARNARIRQLMGDAPFTVETFDDQPQVERTQFRPPATADAVVLFSDGQFDLPVTSPPTYPVIDPQLEHPADASITRLAARDNQLLTTAQNKSAQRELHFNGAPGPTTVPVGRPALSTPLDPEASLVTARLNSADPWPENDTLSLRPSSFRKGESWWVAETDFPANYRIFQPSELPTDAAAYLQAGVIVLNNISASRLSSEQQQRLQQYVRDLGGSLVILGGEQAFAAGGYLGTTLESLSPLASAPAQAQRQWIILADSSGSMASTIDGQTRWNLAAAAVKQVIASLPPNDLVSAGSFARDLRWWWQGQRAADAAIRSAPQDITPSGPTNIQAILTGLADELRHNVVTEIILISDADAAIDDPQALAVTLRSSRASVNLLLTGPNSRSPLLQVVAFTAGSMLSQTDPKLWSQDAVKLARSTMRDFIERRPAQITFSGPLAQVTTRQTPLWNRTWIKTGATEIAATQENNAAIALGALWRVGTGQVAALAFPAVGTEHDPLASAIAQNPRDPRFTVTYEAAEQLTVRIDAADNGQFLNELKPTLSLISETETFRQPVRSTLPQTAPGRYEIALPAPRSPILAVVRVNDQRIGEFAIAGRYAPEFEHIGNNRDTLPKLATQSGGAVIEPSQTIPIDFHWPPRVVSLASILSIAGAVFLAIGLIWWKAA